MKSETPETDACYVRAGMMLANQVDELDKTCRSLEIRLKRTSQALIQERAWMSETIAKYKDAAEQIIKL